MKAQVERGFVQAAKFLHMLHIYRIFDLPYQSQIVPLGGHSRRHRRCLGARGEPRQAGAVVLEWRVRRALWLGGRDAHRARFMEVPAWLKGGPEPSTVSETMFRADRLKTMRMRLSAAYKGVNALLMKEGAQDFRSGQKFDHTVFFGENVDIHHIFPQDWCKKHGIKPAVYRFHHQQDAAVLPNEPDHRRRCAIGVPRQIGKGQRNDAANSIAQRLDGYLRISPDRSKRFCAPISLTPSWRTDKNDFWRSSSRRLGRPPTSARFRKKARTSRPTRILSKPN